jgi:malonyl-CoA/methylmalonyl-CoA synthetase
MSLSELFPALQTRGDAPAVTVGDVTLRYRELEAQARARAHELRARGVIAGERLAVVTEPELDTIITLVAHRLLGAVSVPVNAQSGQSERDHIFKNARVRVGDRPGARGPEGAALILYTSGTSGPPKGAVITPENIASNLAALRTAWAWTEADTLCHALPLFHVHGLVLGLFGTLSAGGHLIWIPRFSAETIAAALLGPATMLFAVPTMYHRLAEAGEGNTRVRTALKKARLLVSGSAALPTRVHERLGVPIYERYRLTETLINCAVPVSGPPRPGLVGPALPGIELRVREDTLDVRGNNVFWGYLDNDDATRAARDADGWFQTGDLAHIEHDGFVRILGRKQIDLIKTGGYKVGAGEVEAALLEHPRVSEVAVVGLPDDDLGQRIVAYVVLSPGADPPTGEQLIEHVTTELAPHKRPREVRFVNSLPRNAMGKVEKHRLSKPA